MIRKPNFKLNWKYALGEVVLIFIGISLAVAFQNWNEQRKENSLESLYYCQLLDDVIRDSVKISSDLDRISKRLVSANELLSQLQSGNKDFKVLIPLILASVSHNNLQLKVTTAAFEDIKSSGNLHLIKDLKLKQALIRYYDEVQGILNIINSNQSSVTQNRFINDQDLINSGWIEIMNIQQGHDTSKVNIDDLRKMVKMDDSRIYDLINDAIYYISINGRNAEHYASIQPIMEDIKFSLIQKCHIQ